MPSNYASTLTTLLKANALETGAELKGDLIEAETYAAQILTELTAAASEPGYDQALIAARNSIALKYAGLAVEQADKIDARVTGIIFGALGVATQALIKA